MRAFLAFAFGALLVSIAQAQDITVRGGEHDGFTRIVLSARTGFGWTQRRTGERTFEIHLSNTAEFLLANAFSRISRTRIASLASPEPGQLRLSLSCDCEVRAKDVSPGLVAIDVVGRKAQTRSTAFVRPVARPKSDLPDDAVEEPERNANPPELPLVFSRRDPTPRNSAKVPLNIVAPSDPQAPVLEGFEEDLVLQLSQAVAEGLLSPTGVTAKDQTLSEIRDSEEKHNESNLLTLTECLSSADVAVRDWSTDRSFSNQLATLRRHQATQFDEANGEDLKHLAQLYLHFGMGAEARVISEELEAKDRMIYGAMAAIFDGTPARARPVLGAQTNCETDAVLWGILSLPDDATVDFLSETAVLHAFDHLPDHLRKLVAPDLVRKLSLWGFGSTSQAILTRMHRISEEIAPELQLSTATALAKRQDKKGAETILKDLARNDDGISAKALEALINYGFEPDPEDDADLIELASAHATERRGTPFAQDATTTDLLAALRAGDFERAFRGIAKNDVSAPEVLNEALLRLSDRADPARFLRHLQIWTRKDGPKPAPKPTAAAAQRLLDLGFADLAITLIKRSDLASGNRTLKLMMARAQLDLDEFEEAEITLVGLTGPEADSLRARIRSAMGDHAYVANANLEGLEVATRRSALLTENWDQLAAEGNGILSDFASWMANDEPVEQELSLVGAEAELQGSQSARAQLRALLDVTRME